MTYSPTQLQLTGILQQFYRRVAGKVTLATGGSTTTAIDTKLTEELEDGNEDDIYKGGTLIVIEDAGGLSAAPEGEASRITGYVASTTTITVSPALTTAIAAGDRILIAPPDFPLYDVIEQVNDALRGLGDIPVPNTSITTAANQTEYTLPLALKGQQLLNVEVQGITSDADDNRWVPVPNWRVVDAAGGTTGLLILPQLASGYTVKVWYLGKHPRVDAFDDYINEYLHPELVHAAAMARVLQWRNDSDRLRGAVQDHLIALEQKAWSQHDRERIIHPVSIPPRRVQGFPHWGRSRADEWPPLPFS